MKRAFGSAVVLMIFLFGGAFLVSRTPEEAPAYASAAAPQPVSTDVTDYVHDADTVLRVLCGDTVEEIPLHEYLCGVVRGEMLPTFSTAALQAQAAAERTYIYYQLAHGGKTAHPRADVCTDPGCCNAYLSEDSARRKWGARYEEYNALIEQAVSDTDGQVVLYENQPILAVFHSSSAGSTAASGDVWLADLPYLASVESPETGEGIPNYYSVNTYSAEEFSRLFRTTYPAADLSDAPETWVQALQTRGERVSSAVIGGVTVTGKDLRSLFGLRSTAFTLDYSQNVFTFHVTGYGHGVGMSQYGANQLGLEGKTWQEILEWYYTGTKVGYFQNEEVKAENR